MGSIPPELQAELIREGGNLLVEQIRAYIARRQGAPITSVSPVDVRALLKTIAIESAADLAAEGEAAAAAAAQHTATEPIAAEPQETP